MIKKVLLLVAKNNFPEAGIWIIVTGGIGPSSMIPAKKPTLIILVDPYEPYPKEYYQKGVKIIKDLTVRLYTIGRMLNPILPETSKIIKDLVKENKSPEKPLFLRKD